MASNREIKQMINESDLLSDQEKAEWVFLLPRMSDEQKEELVDMLSIHLPSRNQENQTNPLPQIAKPNSAIKIEPLPDQMETVSKTQASKPKPIVPLPKTTQNPQQESPKFEIQNLESVSNLNLAELKKFNTTDHFLAVLSDQLTKLKQAGTSRRDIVKAFEKSSLYSSYVQTGLKMMNMEKPVEMTSEDFEKIAEFLTQLRKLGE